MWVFRLLSHGRFGASARSAIWLVAMVSWLPAAEPANPPPASPTPFLRLRETTLGYHGTEADFTNLTELRIGWFGPTNADDPLTGNLWRAANLAIQEANARASNCGLPSSNFQRLPFRLVSRWAADPWGSGVSQLARMVYEEQPLALLGSVDSATTHLAEQVVAKANLPLVSPIATDQSVTLAGVSWMFSCAPTDGAIARVLVDDILACLKPTGGRLALLACTDHESRMTTREALKELSRRGHRPDFRFDVPPGAHAILQQMSALEAARPAAVLIVAGPEDSARLVRATRERLPLPAGSGRGQGKLQTGCFLFGGHSMARTRFRDLAGLDAEGVRCPLLVVPDPADTNAARFRDQFAAGPQRPPDYTAALTYDATRLLIDAIHRAGPNRARIREALARSSPWPSLGGLIQFDGTGQNTRTNLCMATIRNGSLLPLPRPFTPPTTTNHTATL
jgi:branched-chain amino acid transport system substrate-binding protein